MAGPTHLWDDRHPKHYERTHVVRASDYDALRAHAKNLELINFDHILGFDAAEQEIKRVTEERDNLRLRIKAVDKEHDQLEIDRQKMKDGYNKLLNELLERERYGDNKLA